MKEITDKIKPNLALRSVNKITTIWRQIDKTDVTPFIEKIWAKDASDLKALFVNTNNKDAKPMHL